MLAAASREEREIFDLWTRLRPDDAYAQGIERCAGQVFVPTPARVAAAVRRIERLRRAASSPTARKFLTALKSRLLLAEPAGLPETLVEAFFSHMVKEGVVPAHAGSLAASGRRALDAGRRASRGRRVPAGMRALTLLACDGLAELLDTVEESLHHDAAAFDEVQRLRKALGRYRDAHRLRDFRPDAPFEETFAVLRKGGADLGRNRYYARALRELWDYRETPAEVERAGLRMLRAEFPVFERVVRRLSSDLGTGRTAEEVQDELGKVRGLRRASILPFLTGLRERAQPLADRHLVAINPDYSVQVIETPPYLVNTTPSAAAFSLDTLSDRPREIFLATTEERTAGRPTPAELLNLLVHEEYGHCVHGSNASHAYAASPGLLDVLNGPAVCVSEGLAFNMELDFLPILQDIGHGKLSGEPEASFVDFFRDWGGIDTVARDYEFVTRLWRIVRFLRVIGDARINSGKQDVVRFVEWAHRRTGLQRATIYYQLFPAHQVLGPGYASTYAIIGENIRRIEGIALRRGKPLREFNAYATSLGWPPKSVFEARLGAWARS